MVAVAGTSLARSMQQPVHPRKAMWADFLLSSSGWNHPADHPEWVDVSKEHVNLAATARRASIQRSMHIFRLHEQAAAARERTRCGC